MWTNARCTGVAQIGCLILFVAAFAGCKGKEDLGKAKSSVETALTAWKNGDNPQQLASQGIEITDPDWNAGFRLTDFEIKDASSLPQQGPRVVVELNLKNKAGKKVVTEVAYEVLMSEKVKIGRDAFHVGK